MRTRMRVLVIDDEESLCKVLQLSLERAGYTVKTTTSGLAARAIARKFNPHVILCDLNLEDADGRELCAELERVVPNSQIFLFTGMLEEDLLSSRFTVIPKPISMKTLTEMLGPPLRATLNPQLLTGRAERVAGSSREFVLVLKSGPPRFTFKEWYEVGYVVTWIHSVNDAERILRRYPHDLLVVDLGTNVWSINEICARMHPFKARGMRILLLKQPGIDIPEPHCGDLIMNNNASRDQLLETIAQ